MNAMGLDRMLLVPRPGRLVTRMSIGVAVPLVVVIVSVFRSGSQAMALFSALFMTAQITSAVTTSHKEIIAASPAFFQPGLRRNLLRAQFTWAAGLAVVMAALLGAFHPDFGGLRPLMVAGSVLCVHALFALATLYIPWSFQIPVWIWYLWIPARYLGYRSQSGELDAVFDTTWPWLVAAAALLWLLGRSLSRPGLYRRLHGAMVLGADDLFRPGRIVAYKQQRGCHVRAGQGPAWRRRLIDRLIGRATIANGASRPVLARVWQLLALDIAMTVTVRSWLLVLLGLGIPVMMLSGGYIDGDSREGMLDFWFAGLVYQWASWPFFSLAAVLLTAPMTSCSRRTGIRAEVALMGRMVLLALGGSLLTAAVFKLFAAVLPPLTWNGNLVTYSAPLPHGIWLVPMLAPFAWLGVALRPQGHSSLPSVFLVMSFIWGHALLSSQPYGISVPIMAALSLVALGVAYGLRRRWWEKADLPH
jgi:hypothetical protein